MIVRLRALVSHGRHQAREAALDALWMTGMSSLVAGVMPAILRVASQAGRERIAAQTAIMLPKAAIEPISASISRSERIIVSLHVPDAFSIVLCLFRSSTTRRVS
jgi:hypothetical protein